jgi:hypothetical protein
MKKCINLLCFMFLFLLSGCVKGVFQVKVNKDGSGDLDYRLSIDSN